MITEPQLRALWPQADSRTPGLVAAVAASAPTVFPKYGWNTDAMVAIAVAQFSHEFGAGLDMIENLSYTAVRMTQVWPGRFPTVASAAPYAHNPRALGDKVYNGRMGNRPDTDDGYNYRGRGMAQTTGRDEYAALAKSWVSMNKIALDFLGNPDLVCAPANALECGVAVLTIDGCAPYARLGNFRMVTQRLNGGQIGAAERAQWWTRVKRVMRIK